MLVQGGSGRRRQGSGGVPALNNDSTAARRRGEISCRAHGYLHPCVSCKGELRLLTIRREDLTQFRNFWSLVARPVRNVQKAVRDQLRMKDLLAKPGAKGVH